MCAVAIRLVHVPLGVLAPPLYLSRLPLGVTWTSPTGRGRVQETWPTTHSLQISSRSCRPTVTVVNELVIVALVL